MFRQGAIMLAPLMSNQRKEPTICSLNKCPGFETGANSWRVSHRGARGGRARPSNNAYVFALPSGQ